VTPPFPEAALRAALTAAVAAWAADEGLVAGDEPRRVYVDAFAGAELQFGGGVARDAAEPTRAEAALRALDAACAGPAPRPVALFIEEDPAHLGRIYGDLEDAAGERLRATRDFASLAPGEASLVEAPFAAVAAEVAKLAAGARTFAWLAPWSARALPWDALRPLVALRDTTLLIRFPHADFEKQSPHTGPLADLPLFARRIVEGCSAFLGDAKHSWLPAWRAAPGEGLALVLERFQALLQSAAGDRAVRPIALEENGARTWLFLVPADVPARAVPEPVMAEEPAVTVEPEPEPEPMAEPESVVAADPEREPEPIVVEEPVVVAEPVVTEEPVVAAEVEPEPEPVVEPEPAVAEVLDLFPDLAATPPPPRPPVPAKKRSPKLAQDDGFFSDDK
jgi:hypothetical protein